MIEMVDWHSSNLSAAFSAIVLTSALVASVVVTLIIRPLLRRIALARPNERSSHTQPTPQGAGIAVILATASATCAAAFYFVSPVWRIETLVPVWAAVTLIASLGMAEDMRPVPIVPRLLVQILAVGIVIYTLPAELRVVRFLPWLGERVLLVIAGVWFVNLVNFMDGLDWMTVAEVVPMTATLAIIGIFGLLPPAETIVSLALCGAMLGFAYFNRPVAKLFLGDAGSLPIGLLLGWLLVRIAGHHALAAAILLPLYYLADSTITLLRRLIGGQKVWRAHRTHFYQRATDRGFTVSQVVSHVFAVNVALAFLAVATIAAPGLLNDAAALICGVILVAWLLRTFARSRPVSIRAIR